MLSANPLLQKNIQFDMFYIFFKYLIVDGNSGPDAGVSNTRAA